MTSPRTQTRRPSRGHRVLLCVVVGLALVIAGVVIVPQVQQILRTSALQGAVDEAYATARPEADHRQAAGDAVLSQLAGPAFLHSSTVTCTLEHSDAGLMVTSWNQECEVRTVDAYATRLSYPDLSARIEVASQGLDPDVLGVPFTEPTPPSECGPVRGVGASWDHAPQVVVTRLEAGRFSTKATDRQSDCTIPLPVNDEKQTRVEASFTLKDITAGQSWVIVERRTEFFSYDLGCIGLFFCGAPVSGARLPTP